MYVYDDSEYDRVYDKARRKQSERTRKQYKHRATGFRFDSTAKSDEKIAVLGFCLPDLEPDHHHHHLWVGTAAIP